MKLLLLTALSILAARRDEAPVRFSADVAPILARRCLACHDDRQAKGGLNMRTFADLRAGGKVSKGEIVVPADPDSSALIASVRADAVPRMPFKQPPLSTAEIATLERWVKEGAKFDGPSASETPIRSLFDATAGLPKVAMRSPAIEPVTALEFSADGKTLASAVGRSVLLIDAATGKTLATLADHPGPIARLLFTPDGQRLIAAGGRAGEVGSIRVWDLASKGIVLDLKGHSDSILAADLSPGGSILATGSYDRLVKLWDLEKGLEIRTLKEHTDAVYAVSFAPDGRSVASASGDRTVKLWDVATGKKRLTLGDSTAELYSVVFGPGGKTIVAAGVDRSIRVWALEGDNSRLVRATAGHDAPIIRLATTRDRTLLASAGEDRGVKVWETIGGAARAVFPAQSDWPLGLALNADGSAVAVGRYDGSIDLFDVKLGTRRLEIRKLGGLPRDSPKLVGNATLNSLSPRSLTRGVTTRMTLGGNGVGQTFEVILVEPGIKARIAPRQPPDANVADVDLEVAADAPLGVHTVAARTTLGTTPSQPFLVAAEPETSEREPNDNASSATPIRLPALISGVIDKPGDVDFFRFRGEVGQDLTFDLIAKTLGSPANGRMRVESPDGLLLASSAGRLAFRPETTGDYLLKVDDQDLGGSGAHLYRICAGAFPRIDMASRLAIQSGRTAEIRLDGANLGSSTVSLTDPGGPPGRLVPIVSNPANFDLSNVPRAVVADGEQVIESDGDHNSSATANAIATPGGATGTIHRAGEIDLYRFHARKGQRLIVETFAQRLGMPTDTAIEVLDDGGSPIPKAILRPLEETNVAFRDHNSMGRSIRLTQWDRFAANDFVLIGRELTRIDELPRNPDDDAVMWGTGAARGGAGERVAFLGTTPEHHPLNQPIRKVEVHPPGSSFPPSSGLKPITLFHRNDDGAPDLGRDSQITFDPPADGDYLVRVEDVRGAGGPGFRYQLVVREPRPDFRLKVGAANPNVPRGGTALVQVEATRIDGLEGPIDLAISGLPPGVTATGSRIEADADITSILFTAEEFAPASSPPTWKVAGTASSDGARERILRELDPGGPRSGFVSIRPAPPLKVRASSPSVRIRPGGTIELTLGVDRVEGFQGRVPIEVRNLPRGVRVLNIGLNGVLVTPDQTERVITLQAESWARPGPDRPFYAVATCEATGTEHSSPPIGLIVEAPGTEGTAHAPQAH